MGDPALIVADGMARVGTKVETHDHGRRETGVVTRLDPRHNQLEIRYQDGHAKWVPAPQV